MARRAECNSRCSEPSGRQYFSPGHAAASKTSPARTGSSSKAGRAPTDAARPAGTSRSQLENLAVRRHRRQREIAEFHLALPAHTESQLISARMQVRFLWRRLPANAAAPPARSSNTSAASAAPCWTASTSHVEVPAVPYKELRGHASAEPSADIRAPRRARPAPCSTPAAILTPPCPAAPSAKTAPWTTPANAPWKWPSAAWASPQEPTTASSK